MNNHGGFWVLVFTELQSHKLRDSFSHVFFPLFVLLELICLWTSLPYHNKLLIIFQVFQEKMTVSFCARCKYFNQFWTLLSIQYGE